MKFKEGDRVRFLNEAIEGEVFRILSREQVEVIDTHGFAHIARESELVRIDFDLDKATYDKKAEDVTLKEELEYENVQQKEKKSGAMASIISSLEQDQIIYAAMRLHNEKEPLSTDFDLYLVNNTALSICYTLAHKNDIHRTGIDSGILETRSEKRIGVFSQDEIHNYDGLEFQFLFFANRNYKAWPPFVKELVIRSSDFLEPEFKSQIAGSREVVVLMPLFTFERESAVDVGQLLEKFSATEKEQERRNRKDAGKVKSGKEKFTVLKREKTIDLHIEELVKDPSGMNSTQILSHQIKHFLFELDQAIIQHYHSITFIHGVGQGILKNAIREELKKYPGVRWSEAPPERFGYGATLIELA